MKWIPIIARVLMGALFVFGGVAFFFMKPPEMPPGDMATYMNGLVASKYFFYLLKGTEIACGLMLLSGFFVPLALVVLAPIIINIFCVHVFLAPEGLPQAVVIGLVEVYLAFFSPYSPRIKALFQAK